MVACQQQIQEQRQALQQHASDKLDAASHAAQTAGESLASAPNVLVHRYAKTRMVEGARLRAVALRAEGDRDDESSDDEAR